jgi:hypothetical protein
MKYVCSLFLILALPFFGFSAKAEALLLVTIDHRGGLCAPHTDCNISTQIFENGFCAGACDQHHISSKKIKDLKAIIDKTDFNDFRKVKFTETCPVDYDGQEAIYHFYTSHGEEQLASCKYVLDTNKEPFKSLLKIVDSQ